MKSTLRVLIVFTFLFVSCKGKEASKNDAENYDSKTSNSESTEVMPKESANTDVGSTEATTSVSSSTELVENLVSIFEAPKKVEELFQKKPYNIKIDEANDISSCNSFGLIDREKLNSEGNLYWETVTRDDKSKIKLFKIASGDLNKNSKAFVFDYTNSLDTFCFDESRRVKVKLVAGIRIVYIVKEWGLKAGIDGLEKIAASRELNISNGSLRVSTIGWGQETTSITALKNAIQNITVKSYPEACQALLNLMTIYGNTSQVRPEAIPVE